MEFLEDLPKGCPPKSAHGDGCEQAYRFILTDEPTATDFASHYALGIPNVGGADPCLWASCSLFPDMETVHIKRKLKNLRKYPFVAKMKIGRGSGKMLQGPNHIHFWMCKSFDPLAAITKIREL